MHVELFSPDVTVAEDETGCNQ